MQGISTCPDAATLERFLLGQSVGADADSLEVHLERCNRCLSVLSALQVRDTVVEAIQAQRGMAADVGGEAVRRLVQRLKTLRPSAVQSFSPADEAATLPPSPPAAASCPMDTATEGAGRAGRSETDRTEEHYDFLAPGPLGELGRLGHYQVRKVLGTGGMGVVFEAYDPQLERPAAIKAMLPAIAASPAARQRFLREARAAAAIKHDHIVTIYQVDEDRGVPFLAMELLDGESLDHLLKCQTRLPVADVLWIGRETAEALVAAHERGLIHRDIKPGNIFLEEVSGGVVCGRVVAKGSSHHSPLTTHHSRRVKILDFGLARPAADNAQLTLAGVVVGTPAFMAPEQSGGRPVDARADLFSLGCVLYRMATGELPFKGADSIATLVAVATENPRPPQEINPELPPALCELVLRLLAKNPDGRPDSAQAVVDAIRAIEQGQTSGMVATPSGIGRRRDRAHLVPHRRLFRRVALTFAAACLPLFALGWFFGPTIVRIACNEGELLVEISDPQAQAVVEQNSLTLHDLSRDRTYTIKPQRQPLATGDYVLEVTEADGDMRLFTKEFTITRGGETPVRVTFDPKVLTAKVVVGTGKGPDALYADQAHALQEVLDFRDIVGASAAEFADWCSTLWPDFRLALVSTRKGTGGTLFNAVAVREKTPHLVYCLPELTEQEADRSYGRLADDGYRPIALPCAASPNEKPPWTQTQLVVKDGGRFLAWFNSPQVVMGQNAKAKADGFRLMYLEAFSAQDGPIYQSILAEDAGGTWKSFYTLSPDELVATIRSYEEKGWRPDVIAPDWDGRHLRFMLVAVDNRDGVDWRFRMDMSAVQYRKESAKQKAGGLFPLALTSYGDGASVKYAAIWVRYRAAGTATPPSAAPDARQLADRAVRAVSWKRGPHAGEARSFADPAHALSDVLDFQEITGASMKELRGWADSLTPDFHVSSVSNRRGSGLALFNAVAVREKKPLPFRFLAEIPQKDADATWKQQWDEDYRPVSAITSLGPDKQVGWTATQLWVKHGTRPLNYLNYYGTREFVMEQVKKLKDDGCRPAFLDGLTVAEGPLYRSIQPEDQGRKWEALSRVAPDELLPLIEFYQRKGWRPDVLAPHWEGDRLYFMLVAVDNSDQVDWRFRMDMTLPQYHEESAAQKRDRLFPLAIASYGNDADVRYAAIWVRYRPEAGVP